MTYKASKPSVAKFETTRHDLGKGWKLVLTTRDDGEEVGVFTDGYQQITLFNDSMKKLRDLLKQKQL